MQSFDPLQEDGFVLLKDLIPKSLIHELYGKAIAIASELGLVEHHGEAVVVSPRGAQLRHSEATEYAKTVRQTAEYRAVKQSDSVSRVAHEIFGRKARSLEMNYSSWARIVPPKHGALPPHQDIWYVRSKRRFFTVWIPLSDCPVSLGSLALYPGSHRRGLFAHQGVNGIPLSVESPEWWTYDYQAGDAVVFDHHLIHAPMPNRTASTPRFSIDFRIF